MTPAQVQILSDYIAGQPDLSSQPMTPDGDYAIAQLLNLTASVADPTVWQTLLPLSVVAGVFVPTEFDTLTSQERARLQNLAAFNAAGVDPSNPNIRTFFYDVFSGTGGASTRAAMTSIWTRLATRVEWLYVQPPGVPGEPSTLTYSGPVAPADVNAARNLP
jgi:hypothetical protein